MKRRVLMKGVALGLYAVLTAATLIGCGSSASKEKEDSKTVVTEAGKKQEDSGKKEEEVVTLQMWKAASDENRNAWWESIIAEFEKSHPNIKIEYLGVPGDASAFTQKLDMALAIGDAPDIISTFLDTSMIERGIIEPLDMYWDSWENKDQVPQQYIDIYKSMDYKSETPKLYATPNGANVQNMYVRPDLLKNVGLDVPETWNDFFEAAEKTTDKEQGISGYIIRGGGGNASALEFLMYSYSGITDFFIDGKCTINDPLNVEFVEKYLGNYGEYTSEDDVNKSWPEMAAQFQAGKATMMFHNLGSAVANYEAFGNDTNKILATPFLKSVTGKILIPSFKAGGNIITSSSKHKDEAWIFLEWLLEPEQDTRYHELMSTIPINTESQKADWIQNKSYMKMGSDMYANPDVEFCTFPYFLPNFTNIENDYASPNIQMVMLGEMTAQELLDGWAAKLQADYDTVMK